MHALAAAAPIMQAAKQVTARRQSEAARASPSEAAAKADRSACASASGPVVEELFAGPLVAYAAQDLMWSR